MHAVAPRTGGEEVTIAENQLEYKPLTVAKYLVRLIPGGDPIKTLLTRWRFTDEERERIGKGEDLYLACLTFGDPLQPLNIQVGPDSPTNWVTERAEESILVGAVPANDIPPVMDAADWAECDAKVARGSMPEVHRIALALANHALPDDDRYRLSPAMVTGLRTVGKGLMWPHSALLFEIADIIAAYLPPATET